MRARQVRYTPGGASRKQSLGYYDEHLRKVGWNELAGSAGGVEGYRG
jgi:hypothetical protein